MLITLSLKTLLEMSYRYDYPHFALTVDAVIFSKSDAGLNVLLIRRANEPFMDHWAFAGGYVNIDEVIEKAVYRELKEETNISNVTLKRFDIFDAIDRDPRERTVSVVYYGVINGSNEPIRAGDDATDAKWFPVNALPELAFDHAIIFKKVLEAVQK
jgi:8-oxo-dGTP diphosphatase